MTSTHSEAALMSLILGKRGCNITFVVDSSENMRGVLGSVKRLLVQTLITKASTMDSMFNIMTTSGWLSCWSTHMLPCAPDTVYKALSWIHSISCSPCDTDLLAALSTAFSDCDCHAIHFLCTNLHQRPDAVLTALPAQAAVRPLNIFYLQDAGGHLDSNTTEYLQRLTQATRGSCYKIPVVLNGVLQRNGSSMLTDSSVKCCCQSHFIPCSLSSPPLRCSLSNPLCPVTSCTPCDQTLSTEFFPGCRVLARRQVEGFYYLGTIIQQVQGCGEVWIVEFDHPGSATLGPVFSLQQMVCSLDMVNCSRAHTQDAAPGDAVLSPWEPDVRRYGPGRVLTATTERSDGSRADTILRVRMWNGCVSHLQSRLVSPISGSRHDRIVKELQISASMWFYTRSSSCTPPVSFPPGCVSSCERMDGFKKAEKDAVREDDTESPSSSSSFCEGDTSVTFPPVVQLRRKEQRPPWRYWRRTGAEPQHKQPGSTLQRMTSHPVSFSCPVPEISGSPNHSSLFQSLPGGPGRRANMGDVFGMKSFEPQPPEGLQLSSDNAATVYTQYKYNTCKQR